MSVLTPLTERLRVRAGSRLSELAELALPTECAACRRPGTRWCVRCDRALARLARLPDPDHPDRSDRPDRPVRSARVSPRARVPDLWVWGDYRAPLDRVVTAWKDEGRRDLADLLAGLLAESLRACLEDDPAAEHAPAVELSPCLLVPVPSSRRAVHRRGDAPLDSLTMAALQALQALTDHPSPGLALRAAASLRFAPALTQARAVGEQSGLDIGHRWSNLDGSLRVAPTWRVVVAGRRCIVADDVVTTGATVAEAARALRAAGATEVRVAAVAATPRRSASPADAGHPGDPVLARPRSGRLPPAQRPK